MTKKAPVKKKPGPVPEMHPRERMTTKARAAIREYVLVKCDKLTILDLAIRYTLEAERMPRERLYLFLEEKGYKWQTRPQGWVKKD